ncbi:MAG: VWA domain-containing protein [Acidobacteriota bacterium]
MSSKTFSSSSLAPVPAHPRAASTEERPCSPWAKLARRAVVLAFSAVVPALPATAQDPARTASDDAAHDARVWVEVLDAQGRSAESITRSDLALDEGIRPATVLDLGRPLRVSPEKARLVLYFDQTLGGGGALGRAAEALNELTRDLTQLGDIELVSAPVGDAPRAQLRSADPLLLAQRLQRMALTERGESILVDLRERALEDWRRSATGTAPASEDERLSQVVGAVEEEIELVRDRLRQMVRWVTRPESTPVSGPRVLVPVMEGFDLDPVSFWIEHLDEAMARRLLRESTRWRPLTNEVRDLSQALAAEGWIVLPLSMTVTREERKAVELTGLQSGDDSDDQQTALPGVTIRPSQIFGRDDDEEEDEPAPPPVSLADPLAPLRLFGDEAGGELITSVTALRDALDRLGGRRPLTFRSDLDYDDGLIALDVRVSRAGYTVRAPRWRSRGVPATLSDLRLERVVGLGEAGDLTLAAVLEVAAEAGDTDQTTRATLETRLDLIDLEGGPAARPDAALRIVVTAPGSETTEPLLDEVLRRQNLTVGREWSFRRALDLPADALAVAVLIEELDSGLWGGRRATVVRADSEEAGNFLPGPTVLELQRPEENLLRGRVRFEVAVYDARIDRLSFLLDDREVAEDREPPWSARLDLGRTPRRQSLTVVGYDAQGQVVGRDSAVLNGGDAGLAVEIVQPTVSRGTGPVDVEADIAVPLERQLDRVLVFWNNEAVATLYAPPFKTRVVVPQDRPVGYIRVVALLDDGSLAEDVLFMNGPEAGERLDVELVELYVVVTDDDGRPVRGLTEGDFRIEEDGKPQQIATFSDATDLPLTLGMAIDSSASMFVKLPRVQKAASDFLRRTFNDNDRAFVVDFDSQPRLARGTTGDLERVVDSIYSLEASGRTALWESVVYSLVQLQGVRGRKALVVFSDGADEDERFPFRTAMRISREMSVPIYLILMGKRPEESALQGLFSRSFASRADRVTEATGGRVFYAKEFDSLNDVYAEIEKELRSQYLLTYYPTNTAGDRAWRDVDVEVLRDDLEPRTLSGYWN